ncbi:hypothetical protein HOLleu_43266 [Holothuria leucospilota]|uniref:Uncharacterized protein n=1 Tax=Holothuria leucospilota TaxID=206669 RepID=A0A9Q0YBZ3_HOLLE|nr:hypothetical protein HOLleu_43266 [Holothuria leucospilota]
MQKIKTGTTLTSQDQHYTSLVPLKARSQNKTNAGLQRVESLGLLRKQMLLQTTLVWLSASNKKKYLMHRCAIVHGSQTKS